MYGTTRFAVVVFAILVAKLRAADDATEPVSLANARKTYEQECARAVAPITAKYLRWLESSKREYGAKGDVTAALSFEKEISRMTPSEKQAVTGMTSAQASDTKLQEALDAAVAALPPEDQQTAKGLKFSDFAPVRLGQTSHINCDLKVTNKSTRQSITDKITVEIRLLCKNKAAEWSVCRANAKINITEKGTQVIQMGGLGNASVMRDHNGGQPEPYDAHITVSYSGVVIHTAFWKNRKGAPEKWEENDALIYKR